MGGAFHSTTTCIPCKNGRIRKEAKRIIKKET